MTRLLIILIASITMIGCAAPTRTILKAEIERPTEILVNLRDDNRAWKEEFRFAFEDLGYDVVFADEVLTSKKTHKSDDLDVELTGVIEDDTLNYEFRLRYMAEWDIVWYVSHISMSVRDLRTGKTIGSYKEENVWAHPSAETSIKKMERDFLSKLWSK